MRAIMFVNGNEEIPTLLLPLREDLAGAAPHVLVDFRDHSVLFKHRDKLRGRQEPPIRMDPAHQRLRADHPSARVDDRL